MGGGRGGIFLQYLWIAGYLNPHPHQLICHKHSHQGPQLLRYVRSPREEEERVCLRDAINLLSLYLYGVSALLKLKFIMTNQDSGINSSPE